MGAEVGEGYLMGLDTLSPRDSRSGVGGVVCSSLSLVFSGGEEQPLQSWNPAIAACYLSDPGHVV